LTLTGSPAVRVNSDHHCGAPRRPRGPAPAARGPRCRRNGRRALTSRGAVGADPWDAPLRRNPMTYRLVTRSDFDGLVCAVLLRHLGLVDEITFVRPDDVQDGMVEITGQDILTNLPYAPGAHLVFDHDHSETMRALTVKPFRTQTRIGTLPDDQRREPAGGDPDLPHPGSSQGSRRRRGSSAISAICWQRPPLTGSSSAAAPSAPTPRRSRCAARTAGSASTTSTSAPPTNAARPPRSPGRACTSGLSRSTSPKAAAGCPAAPAAMPGSPRTSPRSNLLTTRSSPGTGARREVDDLERLARQAALETAAYFATSWRLPPPVRRIGTPGRPQMCDLSGAEQPGSDTPHLRQQLLRRGVGTAVAGACSQL